MLRKRVVPRDRVRIRNVEFAPGELSIKSAERVLLLLEFFDDVQSRATVMDVADTLGWPQSSTSKLLKNLVALGYLECDAGSGTYAPTLRVALLGNWVAPQFVVGGKVIELMQELSERTGHLSHLVARNGQYAQLIHTICARGDRQPYAPIGATRPMTSTAGGHALLSMLPDKEVERVVLRYNAEKDGTEPRVDCRELLPVVRKVREDGYAMRLNTPHTYGVSIAMPLPAIAGRPVAVGVGSVVAEDILSHQQDLIAQMMATKERYFGSAATQLLQG